MTLDSCGSLAKLLQGIPAPAYILFGQAALGAGEGGA